jgi:exopolysaccharide biosynthesis polyprenyl glycosylphosphotransferase
MNQKPSNLKLMLLDGIIILVAIGLAWYWKYQKTGTEENLLHLYFVPLSLGLRWTFFSLFPLYRLSKQESALDQIYYLFWAGLWASLVEWAILLFSKAYLLGPGAGVSREILFNSWLLIFLGCCLWRVYYYDTRRRRGNHRYRVAILGAGPAGFQVHEEMHRYGERNLEFVGFISTLTTCPETKLLTLGAIDQFSSLAKKHQIEEIIVALEPDEKEQLLQRLAVCEKHPDVRVRVYPGTGELYLGRVDLSELAGLPLIETPERWRTGVRLFYKRVVDLLIATAGMVVLFIPGLVVALLIFLEGVIRRESRGPVFFIQDRLGRDQKSFRLVKFRTMIRTAEENGPILASKLDPRVTRTGWWLRRSGLDELPQLYNVLRGEMSLVGPRPERKEFVKQFLAEHPAYGIRFRLRPGITGLAQIHGFYGSAVESKMRYDLVYTANFSLFLDFWILFKTLQVILTGRKKI